MRYRSQRKKNQKLQHPEQRSAGSVMPSPSSVGSAAPEDSHSLWMTCRAGVILRPGPDPAPGDAPPPPASTACSPRPDDSFLGHFAPLQASADSSCVALEPLSDMELNEDAAVECLDEPPGAALVMKLEQLRQWQQQMQQQLRSQQMQEILQLQQEQHRLLALVNHTDDVEELSGAAWEESTLHSTSLCHQQEENKGPQRTDPPPVQSVPQMNIEGEVSSPEEEQPQDQRWQERGEGSTHEETAATDRPIRPGAGSPRTFEEILEEQLRREETRLEPQTDPADVPGARPKRAFLRRGQGLLRFSGRTAQVKNSRSAALGRPEPLVHRKTAIVSQGPRARGPSSSLRQESSAPHSKNYFPQQGPPSQRLSEPAVREPAVREPAVREPAVREPAVREPAVREPALREPALREPALREPALRGPVGGPSRSRPEGLHPLGEAGHCGESSFRESVELGEFELLEQAAEELSFSSNSSFVLKVLQMDRQKRLPAQELHQRRLSSTPVKSPPRPPAEGGPQGDLEPAAGQVPWLPSVYTFPCETEPPYDKHTYEDHSLTPSEAADSDCEEPTLTEGLHQGPHQKQSCRVLFDDHDTWSQLSQEHSLSQDSTEEPASPPEASPPERVVSRKVAVSRAVEQDPPPSQLMSRLFPALKGPSHNAPVSTPPTAAHPRTDAQPAQSQLLRERLAELEVEIARFKKENAALSKLCQENQQEQEELRRERAQFKQLQAQESSRFEEYRQEEIRKLQKERRLFQKHMSAARTVPNKSERQEIQALKQQLSSLQDELRRKESRWANTHSRLRLQLEALGQDNAALREEVKTLEKLRITSWKKNSSDSEKSSAAKGVKFATPLDSKNSPPALASRGSRRASAPGATIRNKAVKSSLRRPSLLAQALEEVSSNPSPDPAQTGSSSDSCSEDSDSRLQEEAPVPDGKPEQVLDSGARLFIFPNGTRKELSPDGQTLRVTFFNGDTKEVTADQRVIYYYAEAQTTHITYPDGMEVLTFPNNQSEKHFPDGRKEITFPDQTVKTLYPNGREESVLTDGTIVQLHPDGRKEILFITGQREVHTAEYKRREYPDGTVKTVFSDGRQETRYPTGRVRIKDQDGTLLLDTP
uniref:Centromere protein J n=1 Tax=Knipowitschia caucasica TaxID=637954 RepID=A0AAV2JVV5_KNICA